jgi:hypothetical protein
VSQFEGENVGCAQKFEEGGKIKRQGGVIIEERITEAVGGVGHPTDGKDSLSEGGIKLMKAEKEERAVAAASGIEEAGIEEQKRSGQSRDCDERKQLQPLCHVPVNSEQ